MSNFYNETTVYKPRKQWFCYLCGKAIIGKHIRVACTSDGDFHSYRVHEACNKKMFKICSDCEYNDDCQTGISECFKEKESEANND